MTCEQIAAAVIEKLMPGAVVPKRVLRKNAFGVSDGKSPFDYKWRSPKAFLLGDPSAGANAWTTGPVGFCRYCRYEADPVFDTLFFRYKALIPFVGKGYASLQELELDLTAKGVL